MKKYLSVAIALFFVVLMGVTFVGCSASVAGTYYLVSIECAKYDEEGEPTGEMITYKVGDSMPDILDSEKSITLTKEYAKVVLNKDGSFTFELAGVEAKGTWKDGKTEIELTANVEDGETRTMKFVKNDGNISCVDNDMKLVFSK